MAGSNERERNLDPGIKLVLGELRNLRVEMGADRQRADEERRRADAQWRQRDAEWRRRDQEWRQRDQEWRQESRRRDEEWRRETRGFHEEMVRRDAAFVKAFREIRTVGLAIVKTLNRHTKILERIDRRLAGPGNNGRRGRNGRGA